MASQLAEVHYCNTLQHTATRCNTLQHTATHCNSLQHTATPTCQAEKKQMASQLANVAIAVVVKQIQALGDAKVAVLQGAALTATHCITLHCNILQHTLGDAKYIFI